MGICQVTIALTCELWSHMYLPIFSQAYGICLNIDYHIYIHMHTVYMAAYYNVEISANALQLMNSHVESGWAMPFAGAKFHNSRPHVLRTFQILEASETAHCLCWNRNFCCLNPSFFGLYRFPFSLVNSARSLVIPNSHWARKSESLHQHRLEVSS